MEACRDTRTRATALTSPAAKGRVALSWSSIPRPIPRTAPATARRQGEMTRRLVRRSEGQNPTAPNHAQNWPLGLDVVSAVGNQKVVSRRSGTPPTARDATPTPTPKPTRGRSPDETAPPTDTAVMFPELVTTGAGKGGPGS